MECEYSVTITATISYNVHSLGRIACVDSSLRSWLHPTRVEFLNLYIFSKDNIDNFEINHTIKWLNK